MPRVTHDRDSNAARNILAAERAVTARGGGIKAGTASAGQRPMKRAQARITSGNPQLQLWGGCQRAHIAETKS